ncbi:hypothetical protein AAVH_17250 [Aphelenchoides avenae]|nr:hypothetical protein AAVH_17250 [Aphelenchus avenae]
MSDDDRAAFERVGHALMSPAATVSEKKQLAQKLFEEHPQLLQVFLAGRGLFESLEPEALTFFGTLAKQGPLPTVKNGSVDRKQLVDFLKKSVGKYQELNEDAKQSLKSTFPALITLVQRELTNDEITDIISGFDE